MSGLVEKMKGGVLGATIGALAFAAAPGAAAAQERQEVSIAIISVSVYGAWYIARERGFAEGVDIDVQIIEDITARNAGLASGTVQCMMTTMDSTVVTASAGLPVRHIAVPLMSYGLDQMVVVEDIDSDADLAGRNYAADYGFLNHMWMLLTLKRAGLPLDAAEHKVMLPQEAAAAFTSGALDVDVNFIPYSTQSLQREGAKLFKTSRTDRTWERGLISDSIACSTRWLEENPGAARELLRAYFQAIDWWKRNPDEGNAIVAEGLDWAVEDVRLTQAGAIMLNLEQNLGAIGYGDARPVCANLPEGTPAPPEGESGWGELFGGRPDCEPGYLADTWTLFGEVYKQAGVIDSVVGADEGIDNSFLIDLAEGGFAETYAFNLWIGRVGP